MKNYCVITTINKPTKAIELLHGKFGSNLIVVGDKKTPEDWRYKDTLFITSSDELYTPDNHYARKNIGYLHAMYEGADLIYDTDDDNIPNENWKIRTIDKNVVQTFGEGWFNVYKLFSEERLIWPRGFPLRQLKRGVGCEAGGIKVSSIQQGLSDGAPDVDAIWRLVFNKEIKFEKTGSVYYNRNAWCPFNSQSTWWFPQAYPLMYLPVYASFRMCDIWRSFVAQRCLWELNQGVTFHSPSEVFQDRNEHDLMNDFESEVPGYLNNDKIVEILGGLKLKKGEKNVCANLLTCYREIIGENILPAGEIDSLKAWVKDYENFVGNI